MTEHWGYLLTNNVGFWTPYFAQFAEAIRLMVWEKGCYFEPGTFAIFGFIDNTMNATCRPKGGPSRDGVNAPRNDPQIQEAWYNGWKKLHGMKWQTVDLPNGMTYHAWGAISVRHNDLYSLRHSTINDLIADEQLHHLLQYYIYGDSAYMTLDTTHIRASVSTDATESFELELGTDEEDCLSKIARSWVKQACLLFFSFASFSFFSSSSSLSSSAISWRMRSVSVYLSVTSGLRELRLAPSLLIPYFARKVS
jgi:hypothetical protein